MKEQVIGALKQAKYVAIQLAETTDFSSNSQLIIYVRYIDTDKFEEELMSIIKFIKSFKWENCISVSLVPQPAMLGHINGLSAFVENNNPNIDSSPRPYGQTFRAYTGSRFA